ncbi:RNA polymerase sigma factor sigD, chloroplastic-like [Coffea arabica]|uniref:RNA polymerase sigma factor sigD, chloroplastic-like n=1 Tax=Coffea arabica TaxID=13443 RepID=A0A6P6WH62_COFAR
MAISGCSSTNHSSTLPTISFSYYSPTKSCHQVFNNLQLPPSHSSSKHALKSTPEVTFATSTATHEGVTLTIDAAKAARAAVASAFEIENFLDFRERKKDDEEKSWRNGVLMRRKRRRKRRKAFSESVENEKVIMNVAIKPTNSGQYLTPKQEAEYTLCLKEEARVEAVRKRIEETSENEVTLAQWAKAAGMSKNSLDKVLCDGREAQERITRCYRRLVISVASSYQGKGLSLQDLIQEGNLGLLHGAKKFNPEKGYKLSTYVYWWIRQAITKAIAKKSKITRLPGSVSELVPRICEANAVLSRRLRKLPTCQEIAEAVKRDMLTVWLALERNREPISLDQPIVAGASMSLQEIVAGPDETTPEAIVKKQFMKRDIEKLLKGLCDREVNILRLYYGLNGNTPQSFEEIGRHLELSRERVRQISCTALTKLRQTSMVNDLITYILHS